MNSIYNYYFESTYPLIFKDAIRNTTNAITYPIIRIIEFK